MIDKLRKKFIRVTMLSTLGVFLVILLAINGVFIWNENQNADSLTRVLIDGGGEFQRYRSERENDEEEPNIQAQYRHYDERQKRLLDDKELSYSTRYFSAAADKNKNITSVNLEHIVSVDEETAKAYAEKILSGNKSTGWIGDFKFRVGGTEDGFLVVLIDGGNLKSSVISVFTITLSVAAVAFVIIFILVSLFSYRAIKPLAESYEKQKQFVTDAGHELKTPLTVISANTEILAMTYGQNEWSDGIIKQTERMRNLIGRMITLSRMDEGKSDIACEEFSLSDAVSDSVSTFAGAAELKKIGMTCDIEDGIDFYGDEGLIRQLTAVLMDNAVKYCPENGEITVALHKEKKLASSRISMTVTNTVTGEEIETDKLFDRFYRGDKAHTASGSFGLGLSIAKSIADQHNISMSAKCSGGKISFELLADSKQISAHGGAKKRRKKD